MEQLKRKIAKTAVLAEDRDLMVSTVEFTSGEFSTVIHDDSEDSRYEGKWVGPYRIGTTDVRDDTERAARDRHTLVLAAARIRSVLDFNPHADDEE